MVRKKIAFGFALMALTLSCTTSKKALPKNVVKEPLEQVEAPLPAAPSIQSENLPPPAPPQPAVPIPPSDQKEFAVWIDGAGFDAMAALGFLQELEKNKIKPVKIVGSGFGCWVALSWALSNSGNRAEWQSFKWNSFEGMQSGGLLGKLARKVNNSQQRMKTELAKIFPAKDFSGFQMPVDCPLIQKNQSGRFASSRNLSVADALWNQFLVPSLGASDDDIEKSVFYSGVAGGEPSRQELDQFGSELLSRPNFLGWIILRTRTSEERGINQVWNKALAERGDDINDRTGMTPTGRSWLRIDLIDNPQRSREEIRKPENRRRWLIDGRKAAQNIFNSDLKNFFENPVTH